MYGTALRWPGLALPPAAGPLSASSSGPALSIFSGLGAGEGAPPRLVQQPPSLKRGRGDDVEEWAAFPAGASPGLGAAWLPADPASAPWAPPTKRLSLAAGSHGWELGSAASGVGAGGGAAASAAGGGWFGPGAVLPLQAPPVAHTLHGCGFCGYRTPHLDALQQHACIDH